MTRHFHILFLILLLSDATSFAQKIVAQDTVLQTLAAQLQQGNKQAWRDIASYSDQNSKAIDWLIQYSIIPKTIIDFEQTSRQQLLDFYYQQQQHLKFSHLYNAFIFKNLNELNPKFHTKKISTPPTSIKAKEFNIIVEQLLQSNQIDSLNKWLLSPLFQFNIDVHNAMMRLIADTRISKYSGIQKLHFYQNLGEALSYSDREENFKAILQLADKELIAPTLISWSLARVTNVLAGYEVKDAEITTRYRYYRDSLKSFEGLRNYGYERYRASLHRSFFEHDVDYFGAMLAIAFRTDSYFWIKENALHDMLKTKHPRMLFYLASQAFKERNNTFRFGYRAEHFIQYIEALTLEKIAVEDSKGQFLDSPLNDLTALKNYLSYWAIHWDDYEWDDYRQLFVNKKEKLAQKEHYERLFRRLSSTNDSVAIHSFRELSEGDPSEIVKLAAKYRNLLRNVNPNLPDFKFKYLEQLAFFTEYCRNNNIRYVPNAVEEQLFAQLLEAPTPTLRYVLENKLIKSLQTEQLAPFEYWGILHQTKVNTNFSISRILDYWYSQHWELIWSNDKNLLFYIKKASLFAQTNAAGTIAAYHKKIDLKSKESRQRLEQLLGNENDPTLMEYLQKLLSHETQHSQTAEVNVSKEDSNIRQTIQAMNDKIRLEIEEINAITLSNSFAATYRINCLEALKKVQPVEDIFLLKLQPKISISKGELKYLAAIPFNIKDLDDFPRILDIDQPALLFDFIMQRAEEASIDDLGSLINNLFRSSWFSNHLSGGLFDRQKADTLKAILTRYLNESELISEFEEQNTARNIAQLESYNLPIEARLQAAFNSVNDDDTKLKIMNEMIGRIGYSDIGKVLPFILQMEKISGKSAITFLHEDFGIPIFEFENDKALQDFIERHKSMKEKDLYILYLQKYGVDFQKNNSDLDFDKIYQILKFDLVTPYTAASGTRRDDYVYGIIKVLELHFNDRLGFHPKLNESQTFYSFTASKRAAAWMTYLVEKRLVSSNLPKEVMSFN
jgi:hypothetical protein